MEGEMDAFPFVLAEALGMSLGQIGALPNMEVVQWRQFFAYRAAMIEMERERAR